MNMTYSCLVRCDILTMVGLKARQLPDGGWPISWEAPGVTSEMEGRGRWTLDAICRLTAYGVIGGVKDVIEKI